MIQANLKEYSLEYFDPKTGAEYRVGALLEPIHLTQSLEELTPPIVTMKMSLSSNNVREFDLSLVDFSTPVDLSRSLLRKSYIFNAKFTDVLAGYLIDQVQRLQLKGLVHYQHQSLGFYHWQHTTMFLLQSALLPNRDYTTYGDTSFVFQSGNEATYETFLESHILPYPATQLGLVLGLTSVLASRLKVQADVPSIVLNLNGPSSTGKTTIAQFMASLWASPQVTNRGTVRTFNQTMNSIMASLEGINGVPIILDDATAGNFGNKTSLLYTLAQGESKGRATAEGKQAVQGRPWSGLIAITSETPLLSDAETRQGLMARVIDTKDIVWTQSAAHSETMKQVIMSHFGFIGPRYVKAFMDLSEAELVAVFEHSKQVVVSSMKIKDNLSGRIANKLALIHATAVLTKELLGYDLDLAKLTDLIVAFDQTDVEERHIGERGHQAIKLFLTNNYGKFFIMDAKGQYVDGTSKSPHGHIKFISNETMIATIPSANVQRILEDNRIFEYKPVLKYWKDNQLIKTGEDDRGTVKDSKLKVRTVKFIFTRDDDMLIPWQSGIAVEPSSTTTSTPISDAHFEDKQAIDDIFREGPTTDDNLH